MRGWKMRHQTAGLENARMDWLWKADQVKTPDTLPDVNLRGKQWFTKNNIGPARLSVYTTTPLTSCIGPVSK